MLVRAQFDVQAEVLGLVYQGVEPTRRAALESFREQVLIDLESHRDWVRKLEAAAREAEEAIAACED